MTREEIETFVRTVLRGGEYMTGDSEARMIEMIADRWSDDIDAARQNGIYDGYESASGR